MEKKLREIYINLYDKFYSNIRNIKISEKVTIDRSFFNVDFCSQCDIRESTDHKNLFQILQNIRKPVLYWFTIDNTQIDLNIIKSKYISYKESIKKGEVSYRNSCAYKKKDASQSNTLYVGKVKDGFWGRLITHLGYNKTAGTAGMQLFYWYDFEKFPTLTLNYVILEKEMSNLVAVLEVELASQLNPILGKY